QGADPERNADIARSYLHPEEDSEQLGDGDKPEEDCDDKRCWPVLHPTPRPPHWKAGPGESQWLRLNEVIGIVLVGGLPTARGLSVSRRAWWARRGHATQSYQAKVRRSVTPDEAAGGLKWPRFVDIQHSQ